MSCSPRVLLDRIGWSDSMKLRPTSLGFSVLFIASSVVGSLDAQTTTSGALMGVVTDPSNAVVADANVEIRDDVKGIIQETKTDREGVYRFFFLAPSRYALKVWRDEFREESRTVNVLLGPPVTVNVTLVIAKGNTTVEVRGDAPVRNTIPQAMRGALLPKPRETLRQTPRFEKTYTQTEVNELVSVNDQLPSERAQQMRIACQVRNQ